MQAQMLIYILIAAYWLILGVVVVVVVHVGLT